MDYFFWFLLVAGLTIFGLFGHKLFEKEKIKMIDLMSPVLRTMIRQPVEVTYVFDGEPDPPKIVKLTVRQFEDGRYQASYFVNEWMPVKAIENPEPDGAKFTLEIRSSSDAISNLLRF